MSTKLRNVVNDTTASIRSGISFGEVQNSADVTLFVPSMANQLTANSAVDYAPIKTHLVVVIHGMWGAPRNVQFLADRIATLHPHCLVLVPTSNKFLGTYSGIEICALRVLDEVIACIDSNPTLRRISMIGYSAGGIFARYAIGVMERLGLFARIQPINYMSIATPHIGVRFSSRTLRGRVANAIVARASWFVGGRSTQQLTLADSPTNPLLLRMARHSSCFITGLRRFKRLYVVANARADNTVG